MTEKEMVQIEGEPQANQVREQVANYVGRGHKTYTPTQLVVDKAEGVYLWNIEGAKFLDFTSGVLVANLGHNNPYFEERYTEYVEGVPRSGYNMLTKLEAEAARRLIESLDSPKLQRLLWADSGSAGIIKALWCAQHYQPDKPIILATRHGFHGKKGLAGDTTGAESENPNVRFISFPMYEHNETDLDTPEGQAAKAFYQNELNALWEEFPNKICALITEPYLGGAGSFHPPTWYLQLLNTWCEEHNVTFILDEVQSCHGRTGEMYAFQKHGIQPDMVVLGKGVGNGEPVAVTIGSEALIESLDYGEGSDTYSGNPHACAAILAVFDAYEKYAVVENCQKMSPIMMEGLQQLALDFDFVTEVRGEGLVFGVEMHDYGGKTAGEMANAAVRACYDQGLHLMGPLSGKVLRVSPPLIITEEQVKEGLTKMRQAFEQIS